MQARHFRGGPVPRLRLGLSMSSFKTSVSGKINHELAGFKVETIEAAGSGALGEDARWLLAHTRDRTEDGEPYARRSALNPASMKHVLPHIIMLEPQLSDSGKTLDVRVRVMGTSVTWFYGEAGGRSVREFSDDMAAQRALEMANLCFLSGQPVVGTSFRINHDVPYIPVTVLMIPVADDGVTISHFFAHVSIGAVQN